MAESREAPALWRELAKLSAGEQLEAARQEFLVAAVVSRHGDRMRHTSAAGKSVPAPAFSVVLR
jgi:hypothetical protein